MLELGKPIHTFDAARRRGDGRADRRPARRARGAARDARPRRRATLDRRDAAHRRPVRRRSASRASWAARRRRSSDATTRRDRRVGDLRPGEHPPDRAAATRSAPRRACRFEKGQEFRLARLGADRTAQLIARLGRRRDRARARRHRAGRARAAPRRVPAGARQPPARHGARPPASSGRCWRGSGWRRSRRRPGTPIVVARGPAAARASSAAEEALVAIVPTWRRDIAIEADIAEEVARVRGYELVPSVTPDTAMPRVPPVAARGPRAGPRDARRRRPDGGRDDGARLAAPRRDVRPRARRSRRSTATPSPAASPIAVRNPLSRDHSVLRRNLFGSLLDVVRVNLRHGTDDVAVFEIGKGYARAGGEPREWWRLGFALVGAAEPPAWNRPARAVRPRRREGPPRAARRPAGPAAPASTRRRPARRSSTRVAPRAPTPGGRLHAIVGELHPSLVDAWELRTSARVLRGRGRRRGPGRRAARAGARPGRGSLPRGGARPRGRGPPASTAAADVEALLRARGGRAAARRPPVRHLPGRAARRGRAQPRLAAPVRRRRTGP